METPQSGTAVVKAFLAYPTADAWRAVIQSVLNTPAGYRAAATFRFRFRNPQTGSLSTVSLEEIIAAGAPIDSATGDDMELVYPVATGDAAAPAKQETTAAHRPTIIISVHGGLVQDVFCGDPDTRVVLVDWDQDGQHVGLPGVVDIESNGRQVVVAVVEYEAAKFADLPGTDVEKALVAAHLQGQLDPPVIEL